MTIKWETTGTDVFLNMKINKLKSKRIELEKSPLVLEPYDSQDPDTCVFEGYWDANKYTTPITVLGCPFGLDIEVKILPRFTLSFYEFRIKSMPWKYMQARC